MKKLLVLLSIFVTFVFSSITFSHALSVIPTYTAEDVAKHNTPEDCWMIFEDNVYDFSLDHLQNHEEKYMDIASWCGKDMTEAFKTKDGSGEDHRDRVYTDLVNYKIGILGDETTQETVNDSYKSSNPYNFWLPFLTAIAGYMTFWGLAKWHVTNKYKIFNINTFKLIANTIMLSLALIPTVGFGFLLIAASSYPDIIDKLGIDLLYWHVHLSVAFGASVLCHFLTRFRLYKAPIKLFFRKNKTSEMLETEKSKV